MISLFIDTDNRHIISTKSQGFTQTPQDIMKEYNGCSVPQYTAYPCDIHFTRGCMGVHGIIPLFVLFFFIMRFLSMNK